MRSRTTTSTVSFVHSFALPNHRGELPAGSYDFLVEEELVDGLSFEAFRRTASWLVVKGPQGAREMRDVSPRDLDAALDRDQARSDPDGTRLAPTNDRP